MIQKIKSIARVVSLPILLLPLEVSAAGKLVNPTVFPDVQSFIAGFLKAVVIISMPIIALFIIIAGFKFLSARGSSHAISEARDNFKYVIYGAILILGAWALAILIWGTVEPLINGSGPRPAGIPRYQ